MIDDQNAMSLISFFMFKLLNFYANITCEALLTLLFFDALLFVTIKLLFFVIYSYVLCQLLIMIYWMSVAYIS